MSKESDGLPRPLKLSTPLLIHACSVLFLSILHSGTVMGLTLLGALQQKRVDGALKQAMLIASNLCSASDCHQLGGDSSQGHLRIAHGPEKTSPCWRSAV